MLRNEYRKRPGKAKGHPRTGYEGPKKEYWYSSTLSLTSALDGGGWSSRSGRFTRRKVSRKAETSSSIILKYINIFLKFKLVWNAIPWLLVNLQTFTFTVKQSSFPAGLLGPVD
jgi:hypothetical protein